MFYTAAVPSIKNLSTAYGVPYNYIYNSSFVIISTLVFCE